MAQMIDEGLAAEAQLAGDLGVIQALSFEVINARVQRGPVVFHLSHTHPSSLVIDTHDCTAHTLSAGSVGGRWRGQPGVENHATKIVFEALTGGHWAP
jgi:hypothetical protein